MHHPSQKVSFLRKQDSKIMLMIICKHDICRIIFVHIFGDICVCPNVYLGGVRRGSTICGKRVLRASFQEKVGDLYEIYTKENGWCWWNIQQKFDNFSSCPTINTSLSRSTLSSLGEKIPSMINSRSNQRCADIFIRSPPPSTIVLEMILSRAGPDHIWKDNRKLRNGDLVIGLFQFQFCHQNTTNPRYFASEVFPIPND